MAAILLSRYDLTDRIVSALAGIFGLIVALFPASIKLNRTIQ